MARRKRAIKHHTDKRHSNTKYPQRHKFAKAVDTCISEVANKPAGTRMKNLGYCVKAKMRKG